MTGNSLAISNVARLPDGAQPAPTTSLRDALKDNDYEGWSPRKALAAVAASGSLEQIDTAITNLRGRLEPIQHDAFVDCLTAVGMCLAPNRPPDAAAIWIREMVRLLGHLPDDLLRQALDDHQLSCRFPPTPEEIHERVKPLLADRERQLQRLASLRDAATAPPAPKVEPPLNLWAPVATDRVDGELVGPRLIRVGRAIELADGGAYRDGHWPDWLRKVAASPIDRRLRDWASRLSGQLADKLTQQRAA